MVIGRVAQPPSGKTSKCRIGHWRYSIAWPPNDSEAAEPQLLQVIEPAAGNADREYGAQPGRNTFQYEGESIRPHPAQEHATQHRPRHRTGQIPALPPMAADAVLSSPLSALR